MNNQCPCGSHQLLENCCFPHIEHQTAPTAEALMRSRYTAYTLHNAEYLYQTTLFSERRFTSKSEILNWAEQNTWMKLEILESTEKTVTFKAYYFDVSGKPQIHHEKSTFKFVQGKWYYVSGKFFS